MKRRIVVRIDELRLPPGTRGGPRAADAVRRHVEALLRGGVQGEQPAPGHASAARAIHDALAPHLERESQR